MLELPHSLSACHTAVEVNCSCCCCNCPLSAVRVVASTRLALASLRSGLRSVSRHGAHGNSAKDWKTALSKVLLIWMLCVFVWNRSIPHAPCGSPYSTTPPRPAVFVFVCVDRRQIVSTTYLYTHPNILILHYFYSRDVRGRERKRERVPLSSSLVKLAPLWGFCVDFVVCC